MAAPHPFETLTAAGVDRVDSIARSPRSVGLPIHLVGHISLLGLSLGLLGLGVGWAAMPAIAQPPSVTANQPATNTSILVVNPIVGSDATGDGSERLPLKTITRALELAQPNSIIVAAPGTYSTETGETFPLQLKAGVTLQGNPQNRGQNIVIKGGGYFLSPTFAGQDVTVLGANNAALVGVTISNPNPRGYGLWIESTSPIVTDNTFTTSDHDGISVTGNSAPLIRSNYFYQNGANGITIYGTSHPKVEENIFENTGFGINVAQNAAPLLMGNRVTQNKDGIVVQASARPILRNNVIDQNTRDGVVAIAQAAPDLGTATEPGGNIFNNNARFDLNAEGTDQMVLAAGNQLSDRTKGRIDLQGIGRSIASAAAPAAPSISPATPVAPSISQNPPDAITPSIPPTTALAANSVEIPVPPATEQPLPVVRVTPPKTPSSSNRSNSLEAGGVAKSGNRLPAPNTRALTAQPTQRVAGDKNIIFGEALQIGAVTPTSAPKKNRPTEVLGNAAIARLASSTGQSSPIDSSSIPMGDNSISAASFPIPASLKATSRSETVTRRIASSLPTATPPSVSSPTSLTRSAQLSSLPKLANRALPDLNGGSTAIPIPVPPPDTSSVNSTESSAIPSLVSRVALRSSSPSTTAIPIDVPPPESGTVSRPTPNTESALTPQSVPLPSFTTASVSTVPSSGLLPVPSADIPIGNAGKSTFVFKPTAFQSAENPPLPPNRGDSFGLHYRVMVEAETEDQQAQVKSLVPEAFPTVSNGHTMMQVGAFGDRSKADQLIESLTEKGLKAAIEPL